MPEWIASSCCCIVGEVLLKADINLLSFPLFCHYFFMYFRAWLTALSRGLTDISEPTAFFIHN